jgi:hypothetical protein
MISTQDFNRSISQLFSNPVYKEIAQTGTSNYFVSKVIKYKRELTDGKQVCIKQIIQNAYNYLSHNYRNEYLYKNLIANKILLGRHSLRTATMLNEFKVAGSIADIVILNGTSTVYEIKTELDSAEKLQKQIEDYKKAFAKVYIVTHHSLASRYLKMRNIDYVGLLCLTDRSNFAVLKEAEVDISRLQSEVMLKCLRKDEYSALIKQHFGSLPEVSNILFFKECLKWAKEIEPQTLHDLMLAQLSLRKPIAQEWLASQMLPRELKHICLCLNPNESERQNITSFLNRNL